MTSPGWFPDQYDVSRQRYWDGSTWTDHTLPAEIASPDLGPTPVADTPTANAADSNETILVAHESPLPKQPPVVGVLACLAVAVLVAGIALFASIDNDSGGNPSGSSRVAWGTIRTVERTRTEFVETGICQGQVGSLGTCYGSTKAPRQVPYTARESGFICAASLSEARNLVSADTTITGPLTDQTCPDN